MYEIIGKGLDFLLLLLLTLLLFWDYTYYLHIFQLNSYFPERYQRWKAQNKEMLSRKFPIGFRLGLIVLSAAAFGLQGLQGRIVGVWPLKLVFFLWALISLAFRFKNRERAKKPLVYTHRIYRLYGAMLLLLLLTEAVLWWILRLFWQRPAEALGMGSEIARIVFIFAAYFLPLAANYMLMPLEKYFKQKYYRQAQAILAGQPELIRIGITGSYGKTSTKFVLENVLKQQYLTLVTPHSYNTTLGVVRTLREYFSGQVEAFVAEMGAKQPGDIREICDLVRPQVAVITAVGPQHLETFGTIDRVIATKFELAEAVGKNGVVIVNADDANIVLGMERYPAVNYLTYGEAEEADVRISDIRVSVQGSSFTVTYRGESRSYQTRLLGQHNISNLTAGIATGLYLGIAPEKIGIGIRETQPVEHRLELKAQGDYYILDDAFNANPVGANNALEVLKSFEGGKRFIMTPGMVELGSEDEQIHFDFGRHMADCADAVILVGARKTEKIKEGLLSAGFPEDAIFVVKDVFAGFAKVREIIGRGDVLLIENDLPDNY